MALLALLLLTGARDPILVPEVSQHEIQVRQGFTGAELLLFGAILSPDGTRAGQDYDIVVVLKGPTSAVDVARKAQDRRDLDQCRQHRAPFGARPISRWPRPGRSPRSSMARLRRSTSLACPGCNLSPTGAIDPKALGRFAGGLVDLMTRKGLYRQNEGGVKVSEQVLYQARIALPSSVPTGQLYGRDVRDFAAGWWLRRSARSKCANSASRVRSPSSPRPIRSSTADGRRHSGFHGLARGTGFCA